MTSTVPTTTRLPLRGVLAACVALACATAPSIPSALAGPVAAVPAPAAAPATAPAPAAAPAPETRRNVLDDVGRARPAARRGGAADVPYAPIGKTDSADDAMMPDVEMFVGESRVFPAPGLARIAVGNGNLLSASALDDREVILFANAPGTTTLFVWNGNGRYQRVKVHIVPGDMARVAREVATFLATIPNVKTSVVGDKVIVEGNALSDEDRDKVAELAKRYPQIVNFTSAVGWEKMVMMDVKVVEFPKTQLSEIGMKWSSTGGAAIAGIWRPIRRGSDGPYTIDVPASGAGNGLPITDQQPGGGGGTTATLPSALNLLGGVNMGLAAQLNLLEQKGTASILAEPQLSARSGFKASFLAGGEFPYSVASQQGVTILFKQYGIKLDIEPKIGRDGVIRAVIESEVSSIDPSVTTAAGPALLTRRTKTEFNTHDGETIVLSGLLQRNISSDIDKVPFLGSLPVLGPLFRSKRYQNKETELVVFVTPTIVDSRTPGLVDRVQRTNQRLSERLDGPPHLSDPLQPGRPAERVNQAVPALPPAPPAARAQTDTATE